MGQYGTSLAGSVFDELALFANEVLAHALPAVELQRCQARASSSLARGAPLLS
jgi:hypothetical protein